MQPTEPTRPPIDRDLIAQDLDRLATILAPLVEARLPSGAALLMAANGLPPVSELMAQSFRRVLGLSDDELAALIDAGGVELGAWRRVRCPIGLEYLAEHGGILEAAAHLAEAIG